MIYLFSLSFSQLPSGVAYLNVVSLLCFRLDFSCYTTDHDTEVGELGLAKLKHTLGQLVRKLGHLYVDASWQEP